MREAISAAAVTGAARGIGRALALRLAAGGARVAVCDVDAGGIDETARLAAAAGGRVVAARVDVTDGAAVRGWADRVVAELGAVDLVVNNAGVVVTGAIESVSDEDLDWLLRVNFWGVVHGTKALLPHLKRQGRGCIVNVSSAFGLVAIPTQGPYCVSKFAVRAYTDALAQELEIEGSPVRAVCAYPGGVRTDLVRAGRRSGPDALGLPHDEVVKGFDRLARASPDAAAAEILEGVRRGSRRIVSGADARWADRLGRLFPSLFRWIVVRRARQARRTFSAFRS